MTASDDAANQIDELLEFLVHDQAAIRGIAMQHVAALTGGDTVGLFKDTSTGRLARTLAALDARLTDEPEVAHLALKTMVNLTTDPAVLPALNQPEFLLRIMSHVLTPASLLADIACMLLSNLSRDAGVATTLLRLAPVTVIKAPPMVVKPEAEVPAADLPRIRFVRKTVESILAMPTAMDQLVEVFVRGVGVAAGAAAESATAVGGQSRWYNQQADFHFLASVFANVTQHTDGRAFFLSPMVKRYPEAKPENVVVEDEQPVIENKNTRTTTNKSNKKKGGKKPTAGKKIAAAQAQAPAAAAPAQPTSANDSGMGLASTTMVLSESDPTSALSKVLCFTDHEALIRRGGIVSLAKNVTFDLRAHPQFTDPKHPNFLLHALLTSLAPADMADRLLERDLDALDTAPEWILTLPSYHFVEPSADLRRPLLEALLVLATTRVGRNALRDAGAYLIVRESHLVEKDIGCRIVAERIVDHLMRDEESAAAVAHDDEAIDELVQLADSRLRVHDEDFEAKLKVEKEMAEDEEEDEMAIEEIC